MPLYEYQCNDCERPFEKLVRFSEADLNPDCPYCHGQHTQKKMSRVAAFGVSAGSTWSSVSDSSSSCGSHGGFG